MSVSDIVKTEDGVFYCDRYGFKEVDFDESLATKPKNLWRIVFVGPGKPAYAAEIEKVRSMIRIGETLGRNEWVTKNQEYLDRLSRMQNELEKKGIVHKSGSMREA